MTSIRRIAVLTSGGDSPGMNAAVRAVARAADAAGVGCVGVSDGYRGMIQGQIRPLDARDVSGIIQLGGTVLGTARSKKFYTEEGRAKAATNLRNAGVDSVVVIGGDGSMHGAELLSQEHGFNVVGVPGTIDNDLSGTDFTLGFDTAVNTALEAIDKIRDTAASHNRLFFIEVMGRNAGWIALYSGLSGGATAVLVPESDWDEDNIRRKVVESFALGKRFCIVVVAEGEREGGAFGVAQRICEATELDYRVSTLGHMQRGGAPTMRDRILGARLGDGAVTALLDGDNEVMIGERKLEIIRTPFQETWTTDDRDFGGLLALMDRLAR
ncbi:MAG: 6-phosphofructokinase [Euzebya tangerina]|nr:6-phosphofructokinase [Euzebya tangerina]